MNYTYTNFGFTSPLANKPTVDQRKQEEEKEKIGYYVECMKAKRPFTVRFTKAEPNGDFYTTLNGITIFLPNVDQNGEGERYNPYQRANRLLRDYEVLVKHVDEDSKIVKVSHKELALSQKERVLKRLNWLMNENRKDTIEIKDYVNAKVEEEIAQEINNMVNGMSEQTKRQLQRQKFYEQLAKEKEIRQMQRIIVPASVVSLNSKQVVLDIMGYGIPGYVPKMLWSFNPKYDIVRNVKVGDIVDVEVLSYDKKAISKNSISMYRCSRIALKEDPWKTLSYKKDEVIRVKCVDIRQHNWFGQIEGLEDIEVYIEFPEPERGIRIVKEEEYLCHVYRVNPETHLFKARVFRHIENRVK